MTRRLAAYSFFIAAYQSRTSFDFCQPFYWKSLHLLQLFPTGEQTMARTMVHQPVREVLRDSRKLGQLPDGSRVDVDRKHCRYLGH